METINLEQIAQNKYSIGGAASFTTSLTTFQLVKSRSINMTGTSTVWCNVNFLDGGIKYTDASSISTFGEVRILRAGATQVYRGKFFVGGVGNTTQDFQMGFPIFVGDFDPPTPTGFVSYDLEARVSAVTGTIFLDNYTFNIQVR